MHADIMQENNPSHRK